MTLETSLFCTQLVHLLFRMFPLLDLIFKLWWISNEYQLNISLFQKGDKYYQDKCEPGTCQRMLMSTKNNPLVWLNCNQLGLSLTGLGNIEILKVRYSRLLNIKSSLYLNAQRIWRNKSNKIAWYTYYKSLLMIITQHPVIPIILDNIVNNYQDCPF